MKRHSPLYGILLALLVAVVLALPFLAALFWPSPSPDQQPVVPTATRAPTLPPTITSVIIVPTLIPTMAAPSTLTPTATVESTPTPEASPTPPTPTVGRLPSDFNTPIVRPPAPAQVPR